MKDKTQKRTSVILCFFLILILNNCSPGIPSVTPPTSTAITGYDVLFPTSINYTSEPPTPTKTLQPTSTEPFIFIETLGSNTVEKYGLVILHISTNVVVENPYDPGQLNIRVSFTSPTGKEKEIGAFWMQPYDLNTKLRKGNPGWQARFTPDETGTWSVNSSIEGREIKSETVTFEVTESKKPGYVRINQENPRFFAYENGDLFFPIGMNLAWWCGTCDPLETYRNIMTQFHNAGGNTVRVWMERLSFGIEWSNAGLGDYGAYQKQAWLLDQVFSMAEDLGMQIVLVLLNAGDFSNWSGSGWKVNPYNAAMGGVISKPEQFATDPQAIKFFKQRMNYIVNRWGYSTSLMAWEWWNEFDLSAIPDETLVPWIKEMTGFLREVDVNQHLRTNSYALRRISPIWSMDEIDFVMKHDYSNQHPSSDGDYSSRALKDFQFLISGFPAKPVLLGEFGYSSNYEEEIVEKTGIHLHNGLWASTFSGYAGSGMYWYWDSQIETNSLWYHFRGLSRFLKDINITQYEPYPSVEVTPIDSNTENALAMVMKGPDYLLWIRRGKYTVRNQYGLFSSPTSIVNGLSVSIMGVIPGEYTIEWYDPQKAIWLTKAVSSTTGPDLLIQVPTFSKDLAARIFLNP